MPTPEELLQGSNPLLQGSVNTVQNTASATDLTVPGANITTPASPAAPVAPPAPPAPTNTNPPAPTGPQATIWNPVTGEKAVVNLDANGNAIHDAQYNAAIAITGPQWSLWTGNSNAGETAAAALGGTQPPAGGAGDVAANAVTEQGAYGGRFDHVTDPNRRAYMEQIYQDYLDGGGDPNTGWNADMSEYDPNHDYSDTSPFSEQNFQLPSEADPSIMNAANEMIAQIEASKRELEAMKLAQLESLEIDYGLQVAKQEKRNKNSMAALKARLIKLGISPSDSSFLNGVTGQEDRGAEALDTLHSQYLSNKAKIEADARKAVIEFDTKVIDTKFKATVEAANNLLQQQNMAVDIMQIFSARDQAEKDREQQAYQSMLTYSSQMASIDQKSQEAMSKEFLENAREGYYNITDKNTLSMLRNLEESSPYLKGLVGIAMTGLQERMLDMTKKKADINASNRSNSGNGSGSAEEKAFFTDITNTQKSLANGTLDWGQAFSLIKARYGTPDDLIDTYLNKSKWAQYGAYEYQQSKRKTSGTSVTVTGSDGNSVEVQ